MPERSRRLSSSTLCRLRQIGTLRSPNDSCREVLLWGLPPVEPGQETRRHLPILQVRRPLALATTRVLLKATQQCPVLAAERMQPGKAGLAGAHRQVQEAAEAQGPRTPA